MLRPAFAWLAALALIQGSTTLAAPPPPPADDLLTVAEKSDFKATARHAEVVALCEALAKSSPLIRLTELGKSGEGRSLPLMIVSDPPVATPEEAKASGKLVVFLFGNIHAGEVDGKEALPMLVRDLVAKPGHPLFKHLILAVAPIYNADGNERVSKDNRPGQVGPEEGMGKRENAKGLDLNRDFMKLDAPETRALVRFLNVWDPHLIIDTHTTNGSHHRYTITYEGPKNPAGDRRLIAYSREKLFPEVGAALEKATGYKSYFYGNFESNHSRWTSFPSSPRYGTTYFGLRNRLSILTEAYSYASFKDRVLVTRAYCLAALQFTADHSVEVRDLLDDARRTTMIAGRRNGAGDMVAIRSKARAFPGKTSVLGFVERLENGRNVATSEPKDYACDVEQDFVPTVEVLRPFAYLIPPQYVKAIELVQAHGIGVETLNKPTELEVDAETIAKFTRSRRVAEGHQTMDIAETQTGSARRTIPAGTVVVPTSQSLGSLAVYLLEARSDDGLATWNFFDDAIAEGQEFPVLRVQKPFDVKN
jgi:dipeptidyl-peptidase 4